MPTVLRVKGYAFSFVAFDCREPRHVHVTKEDREAKFWLDPVALAHNHGFRANELREIERIINDHLEMLRKAWDDFCGAA